MTQKGRAVKAPPTLLWVGDAVAHTGFATVTHSVLEYLKSSYDVHVLGLNYFGDPHQYSYPIYPASLGGDVFGMKRLGDLLKRIRPHVTCMINDPWLVKDYIPALQQPVTQVNGVDAFTNSVAYMPIDGKNIQSDFITPLNQLGHAIFYTQFALDEARKAGLTTENVSIVPHGVDLSHFTRIPTKAAREKLPVLNPDWFIVGCIARNQPRKRLDLAIQYFAEFARDKPDTVKFYYHGALQDVGWNILQLAEYYGVAERLIITDPNMTTAVGVPREYLKFIYNSFNVQIMTCVGEGWGLPTMEGMACGVPQVLPDWSALGEWPKGAVHLVPCTSEQANTGGLNTIGGIADKEQFVAALNRMYYDHSYNKKIGQLGYDLVRQPQFMWKNVAAQFDTIFKKVMTHDSTKTDSDAGV